MKEASRELIERLSCSKHQGIESLRISSMHATLEPLQELGRQCAALAQLRHLGISSWCKSYDDRLCALEWHLPQLHELEISLSDGHLPRLRAPALRKVDVLASTGVALTQ